MRRNQPVTSDRDSGDHGRIQLLRFLPAIEIDGAGKRSHHHKLSEGNSRFLRQGGRRVKGVGLVCRKAEDKRTEDVDAVFSKRPQPGYQALAREIEVFVNGL